MIVRVLLYWLKIICSSAAANSLAPIYIFRTDEERPFNEDVKIKKLSCRRQTARSDILSISVL